MKKYILLIIPSVLLITIFHTTKVDAQILNKEINRSYTVNSDFLEVKEQKIIRITSDGWHIPAGEEEQFTIFFPNVNDPQANEKRQKTKDSISLIDEFGNSIIFSYDETDARDLVVKVPIPYDITSSSPLTLNFSYKAYGLVIKSGAIVDAYIPGFTQDYEFENETKHESVSTKVTIPKSLGEINIVNPTVDIAEDDFNYTLNFTAESLLGKTAWIQIGTKQYYSFKIEQPYVATTSSPFGYNIYKFLLPSNFQSGPITQEVLFSNIYPSPYSVEEDIDGNIIASFRFPANESGTITIEGYGSIKQSKLNLVDSGSTDDIPESIKTANTAPAKFWEVDDPEIQKVASEIKGDKKDVYEITKATYKYVIDLIDYDETKKFGNNNQRQGALKTLQGGSAVCMEYSDLFIALARAQGIPARAAFGHGYNSLDYDSVSNETFNHQWAEVYSPKLNAWFAVDTTWGENGPDLIGGDMNHFYLNVASVDPETPKSLEISFAGELGTIPEQASIVKPIEKLPDNFASMISIDKLLQDYPAKDSKTRLADDIWGSIKDSASSLNGKINNEVQKVIPQLSNGFLNIVKLVLCLLLPISLIVAKLARRQKRIKSASSVIV